MAASVCTSASSTVENALKNLTLAENDEIKLNGRNIVFFDLETTGLDRECDIIQISCAFGAKMFDRYVFPTKEIGVKASEVNRIRVNFQEGTMTYDGHQVAYVDGKQAIEELVRFLKSIGGRILLSAHNGRRFDVPRLRRLADKVGIPLPDEVEGFLDTMLLARKLYPGRKSYSQPNLVRDMTGKEYDAHNSAADVRALQELIGFALQNGDQLPEESLIQACIHQ